jgi:2',3'-cyclic-nucleotide 2'-phosphodiesterase
MIKIMFFGDVVGECGVSLMGKKLPSIRKEYGAELVIVNGENSADGNGMSSVSAERLYDCGADIITGGNHTWKRKEVYRKLDDESYLVRPANYPADAPGMGYAIADVKGYRVLVMNMLGCVYMEPLTPPHECAEKILKSERGRYDIAVCDFHAEATSEKLFFARYFDMKQDVHFSAVVGTHTHVATSDITILPGGTGYITDLGMCGSHNGILGVKTESIIHKYTVKTPTAFEPAVGDEKINGAYFEIDEKSGKCVKAERVFYQG